MGVSVSGHKNIRVEPNPDNPCGGWVADDGSEKFLKNRHFPEQYEGLDPDSFYHSEYISGPSMAYGGYNRWRDQLARIAGYPKMIFNMGDGTIRETHCTKCWEGEPGPFAEQINFSDCEGTIGPVVCTKLAKDYNDFADKAELEDEWFLKNYKLFQFIFNEVAGNGLVSFG